MSESKKEELLKSMVDKFLVWQLPKDFLPDAGISFTPNLTVYGSNPPSWPVGTNLFTADQAREMFEHCMEATS